MRFLFCILTELLIKSNVEENSFSKINYMKKGIMIMVMGAILALVSCNGRAINGAQIILGAKHAHDTLVLPSLKKGCIMECVYNGSSTFSVTYRDTTKVPNNIFTKEYFETEFGSLSASSYVVKFAPFN